MQSWGAQLKSQKDLRQGEGGKADNLKVALDYEGRISISEGNPEPGSETRGEEPLLCTWFGSIKNNRVVLVQAQQLPGVLGAPGSPELTVGENEQSYRLFSRDGAARGEHSSKAGCAEQAGRSCTSVRVTGSRI